ncbi:MAG TPA: FHA domain-containing protein [Saprospiraceae bacterium]|nr:FHA domain-containing protein [Saprospiraceae bacterium]
MTTNCPFCNTAINLSEVIKLSGSETKIECTNLKCGQIFSFIPANSSKNLINLIEKVKEESTPGKLILQGSTISLITHYDLKDNNTIIGRGFEENIPGKSRISINTEDSTMSRIQCEIKIVRDKFTDKINYTLKDTGSLNGTVLNGEKLLKDEEVYLLDNDQIKMGKFIYKFEQK